MLSWIKSPFRAIDTATRQAFVNAPTFAGQACVLDQLRHASVPRPRLISTIERSAISTFPTSGFEKYLMKVRWHYPSSSLSYPTAPPPGVVLPVIDLPHLFS